MPSISHLDQVRQSNLRSFTKSMSSDSSYTHTHTHADKQDAGNNAYPMKLLKATQARRNDGTDKEARKRQRDKRGDGWRKRELMRKH